MARRCRGLNYLFAHSAGITGFANCFDQQFIAGRRPTIDYDDGLRLFLGNFGGSNSGNLAELLLKMFRAALANHAFDLQRALTRSYGTFDVGNSPEHQ